MAKETPNTLILLSCHQASFITTMLLLSVETAMSQQDRRALQINQIKQFLNHQKRLDLNDNLITLKRILKTILQVDLLSLQNENVLSKTTFTLSLRWIYKSNSKQ